MNEKIKLWILASRPKTLPAAVAPVLVGTALAFNAGKFNAVAASVALICSLFIQIGTNFVNDLYDYLKGTDDENRVGPERALASGWIKPEEMKMAIYLTFGFTFLLGLYLVWHAGWIILLIGLLSILSGYAYTAGPYPLAYNGLGDVFVFLFFGIVAVAGTYYVQALEFSHLALVVAVPVGLLITDILVINNYRDADEDAKKNKQTLVVKFGKRFARLQYLGSVIIAFFVPPYLYLFEKKSLWIFLPILSLPLAVKLIKDVYKLTGTELNKTLEQTAKLSVIYSILFSLGIAL
jgi:1,4-dihydroxy-2-naphthoate octaprenyltransferase